ncbi:ComF family protein [Marinobacter zhejiangensis]|uniref:ComF family protein n=1 Tax=Marinobacter zhejiangensis TaxID=488535 RepID=UPI001FDEF9E0|nr:ComF family protein [Marinobacter zhejiangensis]
MYQFPLNRMIGHYKYRRQLAFGHPLINLFGDHLASHLESSPEHRPDLLIPSPMHKKRRRQRGFNQADDIAEQLSKRLGIPWSSTTLERVRVAPRQSGLNRRQRMDNLKGVVRVNRRLPAKVAIIDDVMTTGATARILARELRSAGASDIQIWVLARTPN